MRSNNKQRRLNRRLYRAARTGQLRELNKALEAGADVRAWRSFAMGCALEHKRPHIIKRLLEMGLFSRKDNFVTNEWFKDAYQLSTHRYKRLFDVNAEARAEQSYWKLIHAIRAGNRFKFRRLLDSANLWGLGQMPLRVAAEHGRFSMVKSMLEAGMNPYDESGKSLPTLHFAIINNRPLIARRLLAQRDHFRKHGQHRERYIQNALPVLCNNPQASETFFIALCSEAGTMTTEAHSELLYYASKPGVPVSMLEAALPLGDGKLHIVEPFRNSEVLMESFEPLEDVLTSFKQFLDSRQGDVELESEGQKALGHIIKLRLLLARAKQDKQVVV